MVSEQIEKRGIRDHHVLMAMRKVPRHQFIQNAYGNQAYDDEPISIGCGQTISQPYMVALMTESLELDPHHKVLEIGTGSGYQTAILAELAARVFSIERYESLAERARKLLNKLGYENILIHVGDGSLGLIEWAPYDRIIVTAGAPDIPPALTEQLVEGGRIVIPIGNKRHQELVVGIKTGEKLARQTVCGCVFVPLIGQEGWKAE